MIQKTFPVPISQQKRRCGPPWELAGLPGDNAVINALARREFDGAQTSETEPSPLPPSHNRGPTNLEEGGENEIATFISAKTLSQRYSAVPRTTEYYPTPLRFANGSFR